VLASLTLDQNGIFGELHPWGDCKEADKFVEESTPLLDAIKMSNLTSLSLSKTGMGPNICSRLATSFSAVLASLTLDRNGIFGELWSSGSCKEADKYVGESAPLLDAIKISNLTSLSLSSTGMGPIICSRLATSLGAALAQVDIRGAHVEETDLEALRVAAPEGCEVVWEPSQDSDDDY
jgi:hypothetical protein